MSASIKYPCVVALDGDVRLVARSENVLVLEYLESDAMGHPQWSHRASISRGDGEGSSHGHVSVFMLLDVILQGLTSTKEGPDA